jgi:uncharacterized Zn-finger protein
MVRRFSNTTSPPKEGLSQHGRIVSNSHADFRGEWTNPARRSRNLVYRSVCCKAAAASSLYAGLWAKDAEDQDWGKVAMADHVVPHFHNDAGVAIIEIGAREFMCVGATPPFDHPHVFLDHGRGQRDHLPVLLDAVPPQSKDLGAGQARPPERVRPARKPSRRLTSLLRRPTAPSRTIVVAGAGIGGLSAALALAATRISASS